jgi:hypothetical protein
MIYSLIAMLATLASVQAACDNQCSGHGHCEIDDVCKCYDNWGVGLSLDSGDCSDRICPFELAWVETPVSLLNDVGHYHRYAECANRGICDRSTGNCECFDGYEGKGCQRTTCPNDCSGHGTCEYIEDLRYRAVWADYVDASFSVDHPAPFAEHVNWEVQNNSQWFPQSTFRSLPAKIPFHDWDKGKTRGCVCDAQYADVDCSKRMCPYGTDVLDVRDDLLTAAKYQTQRISIYESWGDAATPFWEGGTTFALTFKSKINETFTTVPISLGYDNIDDFETDVRLALISLPNHVIDDVQVVVNTSATEADDGLEKHVTLISVTFSGNAVQGKQNLLTVESFECRDGCTPKIDGLKLDTKVTSDIHSNITQRVASNYHSYECGRRGKCDYSSGLCQCFEGYSGDNCNQQTILV